MPIYAPQMTKQVMMARAETHVCAECQSRLVVCWGGYFGTQAWMLRCSKNWQHEGIERPYNTSAYDTPGFNLINFRRRTNEMNQALGPVKAKQLAQYQQTAVLSKEQARIIIDTVWPKAPDAEKVKAVMICTQYNLNPLMKHIFLIPFGTGERQSWATVLGIKATRLMARQQGRFSYIDDTPRLMTNEEQKRIFGVVATDRMWAITKIKDSQGNTAQGYGFWPNGVGVQGADKGNTPLNMAFIRSERQAFDRLFPGILPSDVGVVDETAMETPGVDEATGEVIEGTASEVVESIPAEEPQPLIDSSWLGESLAVLRWKCPTLKTYINTHKGDIGLTADVAGVTPAELVTGFNKDQAEKFCKMVEEMKAAKG
jgi:hypothetical protein